jgi:hypothetical protein
VLPIMFLLGELHVAVAELSGAAARRGHLGRQPGDSIALRDKLAAEHARAGYNGAEAAALLGLGEDYARDLLRDEAQKTGRDLAVPPAVLFRQAATSLTMSLNGELPVPDDCAARLAPLSGGEIRLLAAEMRAAECREESPLAAGLARFLEALRLLGDERVPLGRVAAHYGAMLAGSPWDLGYRGKFAGSKKADVLRAQRPAGRQRVHLRICTVPAARVLALGRNTWAVRQRDPRAVPPPLDTFLPGVERRLAAESHKRG